MIDSSFSVPVAIGGPEFNWPRQKLLRDTGDVRKSPDLDEVHDALVVDVVVDVAAHKLVAFIEGISEHGHVPRQFTSERPLLMLATRSRDRPATLDRSAALSTNDLRSRREASEHVGELKRHRLQNREIRVSPTLAAGVKAFDDLAHVAHQHHW